MSICGTWLSFVSWAVIGFGRHSLLFVGSCFHLWMVIFIVGHRVVVAVGSVVGLWLVEERSDVTSCDITCTISHDFLAVHSKNPSVLVQSSAEVKFSPQGWSQSC